LCGQCIRKTKGTGELKDVFEFDKRAAALKGAFAVDRSLTEGKRLLLFDDLYRSGATVTEISHSLTSDGPCGGGLPADLTRTRSRA